MCRLNWEIYYLPVALVIWSSAAFIISFIIAVCNGHVVPFVPFISDTGTIPPESCVFGIMINFSAFLGAFTMSVRYKMLQTLNEANPSISSCENTTALVFGLLGCLGMFIVANFQETAVRSVHDIGALLTFGMGTIYLIFQTWISYKMLLLCNNRCEVLSKAVLTAVSVIAFIIMFTCYILSGQSKFNWDPTDKKFTLSIKMEIIDDFQDELRIPILSGQR
ncbi:DNA damage-regulated autophagy modulator protein 1 isoform X2 [Pristis pectinata]|uniref:DNA damage-regulated autophagy modulator protein 1 isoform X2 n=1 Tax=Pristis pectinata TaxID=685728 RepID=UPI00223D9572|nr:DNA damage-regulated autophagy modulator protein 1 isoform X2 [Pristis pectinata]